MKALRDRWRDPSLWTDVSQLVKTVVAAVLAWQLAVHAFSLSQSLLAPWAALLTVNATVYRTLARGLQQVGAAVLGVLLAFAAGTTLGVNAGSLGLVLLVAMLVGSARALRAESTTAAATALVVLLAGYSNEGTMLLQRLLDTGIGIGVGLLVNLVVWPPLRDRSAARHVDRIDDALGVLLTDIADGLRDGADHDDVEVWVDRSRAIDHDIDAAWAAVRWARESGRMNLRRSAQERVRAAADFESLLARLEQALAEVRSMARTVGRCGMLDVDWDPTFRSPWLDLLARTGRAVTEADPAAVGRVRSDLEATADAGVARPLHGALLVNLHNVVDAMDRVADAQPVRPATRRAQRLSAGAP